MAEVSAPSNIASSTSASKPKRVRTGCLTCRERHLKCDEAPGECMNCRKSQRECRRGVRLNFIDTKCDKIPEKAYVPLNQRESGFLDESREIASEYQGGLQAYGRRPSGGGYDGLAPMSQQDYDTQTQLQQQQQAYQYNAQMMAQQAMPQQSLPQAQSMAQNGHMEYQYQQQAHEQQQQQQRNMSYVSAQPKQEYEPLSLLNSATSSSANAVPRPHPAYSQSHDSLVEEEQSEIRDILNTAEETLFMQVFVEEVGLWMDSMDSMKHVSWPVYDIMDAN
jgi:chemotaxis protein histidine kinase CheA